MAHPLKTKGLEELASLKARVLRQHTLKRISGTDRDILVDMINKMEAKITSMHERGAGKPGVDFDI